MAEPLNILIVDDNKNNLFTLHTLLDEHIQGIQVIEADSGIMALQTLLQEHVDLIILDVQMPEMDGFEAAQMIRSRKKTRHIPIVFLTAAYQSDEFKERGFALGAADYLTKPIDTVQLTSRIKSYLRFIEQERLHTAELSAANQRLKSEIRERREAQEALLIAKEAAERAQEEAEEANRSKSQFIANMSHELRTPLNAIIGYSEMLREEAEDMELDDFVPDLKKVQAAGRHLLSLINDVLDMSKIEAGKIELYLETFELAPELEDVLTTALPLMEKNHNELKLEVEGELSKIHADLTKLRQMMLNLLSNAAKFTDHGTVYLKVRRYQRDGEDWFDFAIQDTGIGMSPDEQERLFTAYSQATAQTAKKYGGTGLGLVITQKFAEMMGGGIQLHSIEGEGTCFTVSLPATCVIAEA